MKLFKLWIVASVAHCVLPRHIHLENMCFFSISSWFILDFKFYIYKTCRKTLSSVYILSIWQVILSCITLQVYIWSVPLFPGNQTHVVHHGSCKCFCFFDVLKLSLTKWVLCLFRMTSLQWSSPVISLALLQESMVSMSMLLETTQTVSTITPVTDLKVQVNPIMT